MNRTQHKQWWHCKHSETHGLGGEGFFLFPLSCEFLGIKKKSRNCFGYDQGFLWSCRKSEIFDLVVEKCHWSVLLNRNTWPWGIIAQNRIAGCKEKGEEEGESSFWAVLRVQRAKCRLAKEPSSPWRAFLGEVAEALHLYIFLMKPQVPESTALPSLFDMVTNSGGGGGGCSAASLMITLLWDCFC